LPEDIERKLISFGEKLNIKWCSFDLIQTKDDQFYWLEANRPGAHYWLEVFVGLEIGNEIIDVLIEKNIVKSHLVEKEIDEEVFA